jgi:hypothetical protein
MTGRPKGVLQTSKRTWFTHCVKCGCQITNLGSGRPRTNCGNHKKPKRIVLTISEKKAKIDMARITQGKRDRAFINQQKLLVGRCAMHPFLNDGQEYRVTERNVVAFCWDHIDRETKVASLAQMVGRKKFNRQDLLNEIAKCVLVCANCHQIKTYESNDYRQVEQLINQFQQPSLFDN